MTTLNLHTDGGEFYLIGTTESYSGYYNIRNGRIYTGRSFSDGSRELVRIPHDAISYKNAIGTELPSPITVFVPSPTKDDYSRGWFIRFFARQANVLEASYVEIDESQYTEIVGGKKPFYTAVQLRWKITGPEKDIVDAVTLKIIEPGVSNTNDRSIKLIERTNPTLRNRLQNLLEFWKNDRPPYFAPPLKEMDNKLNY